MHEITTAQVLVLYNGMAEYIELTNPFGSGDESEDDDDQNNGASVTYRDDKLKPTVTRDGDKVTIKNPYYDDSPQIGDTSAILSGMARRGEGFLDYGARRPVETLRTDILDLIYPDLDTKPDSE